MRGALLGMVRTGVVAGLALSLVGLLIFTLSGGSKIAQAASTSETLAGEMALGVGAPMAEPIMAPGLDATLSQAIPWTPPANAYRIFVKDDGLYSLSYDYLLAAGLPVDTLDPASLRMFFLGQEMPIQVDDGGDGQFNAGDQVIFFGRNVDTLFYDGLLASNQYVNELVYFLSYGGASTPAPLRMDTSVDGSPSGAAAKTVAMEHILDEFNYRYESNYPKLPISGADHFFGQWIQPGSNNVASRFISIRTSSVDTTLSGQITMTFQGAANGPHYLRLYLGDTQIYSGTDGWSEFDAFMVSLPITPGLFVNGTNRIKVELVNMVPGRSYDRIYINRTEVDYPRQLVAQSDILNMRGIPAGTWTFATTGFNSSEIGIYDVTDPFNVHRIMNGSATAAVTTNGATQAAAGMTFQATTTPNTRFVLGTPLSLKTPTDIQAVAPKTSIHTPAEILDTSNRYDYLIITHGDFWEQMKPLAQHRTTFYDVAQIDVQDIYDRFNGGMMSAQSIRDFLLYARTNWSGDQPEMVLLVGDGAVDMRNFTFVAPRTFIPPFMVSVDPYLGETASDNRFVMLEGGDLLPDMAIGRFPGSTPDEVAIMVQKTLDYENTAPKGGWNSNILFVSDDLEGGGGDFYGYSDVLVSGFVDAPTNTIPYLPDAYSATRAYLGETCDLTNASPANECRAMISETLNVTGALFVSYVGHASKTSWALEQLMDGELVAGLDLTKGQYPIILAMTCLEGSFHDSSSSVISLAESYMRSSNGAVASWSPTGLGVATGHDVLEQAFFMYLFQDDITEIGRLTVLSKRYLDAHQAGGRHDDLLDTYVLFGDPGLRIQTFLGPSGVEMAGLDAVAVADTTYLSWQTVSEAEILGFNVLRAAIDPATGQAAGSFEVVNSLPILAQGSGGATGFSYSFADLGLVVSTSYRYSLEILKTDGTVERYGVADIAVLGGQLDSLYLPAVVN